jgi:hypothetical protein
MKGHEMDVYAARIGEMADAYNKAVVKKRLGRLWVRVRVDLISE